MAHIGQPEISGREQQKLAEKHEVLGVWVSHQSYCVRRRMFAWDAVEAMTTSEASQNNKTIP